MTAAATRGVLPRLLVALGTSLILMALLALLPPAAQAHAGLVQSWPAEGRTDRPVLSVKLRFGSPLAPGLAQVTVTGPGGPAVAGDPEVTGADVEVPLRPLTRAGAYQVAYRVVAADGHVEVGTFSVAVSATSAAAAAAATARRSAADPGSSTAEGAGRRPPGADEAESLDEAEVDPVASRSDVSSAAPSADVLDVVVTGGGAVALGLLVGLHLLLRRRGAPGNTP